MSPIVEHAQGNTHGQVRPKMGIARMMMMTIRMTMTMTMTMGVVILNAQLLLCCRKIWFLAIYFCNVLPVGAQSALLCQNK